MQVGDLVKWRAHLGTAESVGLALIEAAGVWWTIQWSNGEREIVSELNVEVINASR